jgi:hypothetical protein
MDNLKENYLVDVLADMKVAQLELKLVVLMEMQLVDKSAEKTVEMLVQCLVDMMDNLKES